MTTVKFTVAVAVNVPAPDVKVDAAEAMSGSVSAAVPNKLFNTIDGFIFCFLCCAALCKAILGDSLTATIEPKSQFDSTGLKFCRPLPTFLDFCALVNTKSARDRASGAQPRAFAGFAVDKCRGRAAGKRCRRLGPTPTVGKASLGAGF
jgi:hypothetical protein